MLRGRERYRENTPTELVTLEPEDALRGFYAATFRDRDFQAACRYAAPDFYLKPSNVYAGNFKLNPDPGPVLSVPTPSGLPGFRSDPVTGPCATLAERVYAKRGHLYPWEAWKIHNVTISEDGQTADAHTSDGSAALRLVGHEWRVAWVHD